MRRKLFLGVSFVVFMFMIIAWQYATAEIADLQREKENSSATKSSELVYDSYSSETSGRVVLL